MTVINAVLCALKDFSAVFGLLSFFVYLIGFKLDQNKARVIVASIIILIPAVMIAVFPVWEEPYDAVPDALSNILYYIVALLLIKKPKPVRMLFLTLFFTFTVEVFWGLLAYYTTHALWLEYAFCTSLYILAGIIMRTASSRVRGGSLYRFVISLPWWGIAALLFFEIVCYYKAYGETSERFDALFLLSAVFMIVAVLLMMFRIARLSREERELLDQMAAQKEYAESRIDDDEELRAFRHDYKNHMIVVDSLLQSGNAGEARAYILAMSENIESSLNKIKTGNFVSDTIFNSKRHFAERSDTVLSFTGVIPGEGISDVDLCAILSNLLDNAVEACARLPGKKHIFVEAKTVRGNFVLSITNPTQLVDNHVSGLKTTKPDKKNHGYGLRNVKRIVKKYDGTFLTSINENTFSADLMLKLPQTA